MRFALLLVATLAAFGQGSEIRNPHGTPAGVAAGAKIFRSHCAECHGLNGEGGRGPNLATGVFFHGSTDADLFRNVSEGIPGTAMPSLFFPPDGIWQVVAYVRSLSPAAGRERPPGDPARGSKLLAEQGCLACHLVRGEGGVQGPDLSVIGSQRSVAHLRQAILDPNATVAREFWVAKLIPPDGTPVSGFVLNEDTHFIQILDFSRGLRSFPKQSLKKLEIDKNSVMPSYQGKLSESELNDLVAYLWSLRRPGRSE